MFILEPVHKKLFRMRTNGFPSRRHVAIILSSSLSLVVVLFLRCVFSLHSSVSFNMGQ